jgi:hypothetical protein
MRGRDLGAHAVRDGGEETVCVRGEINSLYSCFHIEYRANEGRVLVTETVVFLTGPGTCLDVIETSDWTAPTCFLTHFDEFRILHHHGVHDSKEGFI